MKKILIFSFAVLGFLMIIPNVSKAQVPVCPVGYICVPSSEIVTANCPQGYVCVQDPSQTPSASVVNQISYYSYPQPNPYVASSSFSFKVTAKNMPVYIIDSIDSLNMISSSSFKYSMSSVNITASPGLLAGDTRSNGRNLYIVPEGTSRTFYVIYSIQNIDTKPGAYVSYVSAIKYLSSPVPMNYRSVPIDTKSASVYLYPKCANGYKPNTTDCREIATTSIQVTAVTQGPVIVQNYSYMYPFYVDLNVTAGDKDVVISKNSLNVLINTLSPNTVVKFAPDVTASPGVVAGDTSVVFRVPSNTSRKFRLNGNMTSVTGTDLNYIKITGVKYGSSSTMNIDSVFRLVNPVQTNPIKIDTYPCSTGTVWDGNTCKTSVPASNVTNTPPQTAPVVPAKSSKDTSSLWDALRSMF
jgi:hypothetical protein